MTRVSVITICYNDMSGLERTLKSVREQHWGDVEHVVVDGGSKDGTRELLQETSGVRWVSEPDHGRYDAMNKGVAMSTGSLLWFMNSADTFATPGGLGAVIASKDGNQSRWGYGLSRVCFIDGRRSLRGEVPYDAARFFLGKAVIPHQASFFERSLFDELGGYVVDFGLTADQLFMMCAAMREDPLVIPEVLCDFDGSGAGSTRSAWDHYKDVIRARRFTCVTVTGWSLLDDLVSVGLSVTTRADRVGRRLTARLIPRHAGAPTSRT